MSESLFNICILSLVCIFLYEIYSLMRVGIDYISEKKELKNKKPFNEVMDIFIFNTLMFFAMGIMQLFVFSIFTSDLTNLVYMKIYAITPVIISFNFLFWLVNLIMMITEFTNKNLENV